MQNGYNISKVIIIAFDDSPKGQFTLAKTILDKYGHKGSFLQSASCQWSWESS
jgi:peptidoglycan/xylan/chitin deacetylase (PgdA/CDA1 family)